MSNIMREDWIESNLGVLSEVFSGVGFPRDKQGKLDGQFPFYKVGDISKNVQAGNRFLELCDNYIDTGDIPKIENKVLPPNTITFAKIGEALKLNRRCITKEYSLVDNNAIGVKANESLNDLFLYFYLLTIRLENYSRATTVPSVRKTDIENIRLPLSSLPEQRAIVAKIEELFSDLDKGIADLKKAQDQLKVYRQAVLKKAFEGELTKEWRDNRKSKLEKWCTIPFGQATNNFDGKRKPLSLAVRKDFQGIYPYYGACEHIDNVKEYIFDGEYMLIGEDGANLLSKSKPLSFIVEGQFWVNNHAHVVQPVDGIDISFLNHQFNSLHINEYVTGTAQSKLNQRNLNKIPVRIPSIEEQHQIVQEIESRLSVCDKVEESITESLEKARALRQSILKKAFEGTLLSIEEIAACKAAPDYEPASVLLEKIKEEKSSANVSASKGKKKK